jgi:hypothetical protein
MLVVDATVDDPDRHLVAAQRRRPGLGRPDHLREILLGEFLVFLEVLGESRREFVAGVGGTHRSHTTAKQAHRTETASRSQQPAAGVAAMGVRRIFTGVHRFFARTPLQSVTTHK